MRPQTVTDDLEAVAPLVVALANRYQEYENSGSSMWDRTVNVRKRPDWLREAATIEHMANDEHGDVSQLEDVRVEVDPFTLPVAPDPDVWEASCACFLIRLAKCVLIVSSIAGIANGAQ